MSLKEYNLKRKFNETLEPKGKPKNTNTQRFVVQLHHARAKHYDLRLEFNGVLLSWAVPKGLSLNPLDKRLAVMVEDHPIDYINFEGIIPKGNYGAGTVEIFDKGSYLPLFDFQKGLKKGHLNFILKGEKLKGEFDLIKTTDDNWLIIKAKDEFASTKPTSTKLPFSSCTPQLATLTNKVPEGKNWVFEIKYDGYRMLAYKNNKTIKIVSRTGKNNTIKFKEIATALEKLDAENFVIDGELVAFDNNGRSDFGLLQESIKQSPQNLCFVAFDLLALDGQDLRNLPLLKRKQKLEMLLFKAPQNIIFSSHVENGKKCFEFAKKHNLEGIIAKKIDKQYFEARSDAWLKIKCTLRQEFVVAGFTTTDKNQVLSALILGYYNNKELVFVGKVGVGLTEKDKLALASKFKKVLRKTCPFLNAPKVKNAVWISPKFVAEIEFAEITKENLLRQPKFLGLRTDKKANDVVLEIKNAKT